MDSYILLNINNIAASVTMCFFLFSRRNELAGAAGHV